MKKHFFLSLLAAVSCLAMVSCGDDDNDKKDSGNELVNKVSDNQMIFNDEKFDLTVTVSVRPPANEDVGAYYVDVQSSAFVGRFDLGTPLKGVIIDLADPVKSVNENQLSFGLGGNEEFVSFFSMDVYDSKVYSQVNEVEYSESSGFSEGSLIFTHTNDEFTLTMYGTLKNNDRFALKLVVPEDEVDYWNNN